MKCEQAGCEGHLGKFSSCVDEAVYFLSLDWFERWDGDMDFGVSWCVMDVPEDATFEFFERVPRSVVVPAGVYLVEANSQGFVWVTRWEPLSHPVLGFVENLRVLEASYALWLDESGE